MTRKINPITTAISVSAMSRRSFIKTACAATTALAAGQLAAQEQAERAMRDTGSSKITDQFKPADVMKTKDEFKPGDKIPTSGIYDVVHDRLDGDQHAHPHQVTTIAGSAFPRCRGCQGAVRFRLRLAAEYVPAHHLFKV